MRDVPSAMVSCNGLLVVISPHCHPQRTLFHLVLVVGRGRLLIHPPWLFQVLTVYIVANYFPGLAFSPEPKFSEKKKNSVNELYNNSDTQRFFFFFYNITSQMQMNGWYRNDIWFSKFIPFKHINHPQFPEILFAIN